MNDFIVAITPALTALVLAIIAGATTLATAWFYTLKVKIEERRDREALHSAMKTGAAVAFAKGLTGLGAIDATTAYVRRSTPDAVANLGPPETVLDDIATRYLGELRKADGV